MCKLERAIWLVLVELLKSCQLIDDFKLSFEDEFLFEKAELVFGNIKVIRSYLKILYQMDLVNAIDEIELDAGDLISILEQMRGFIIPRIREALNNIVDDSIARNESFWDLIHPRIRNIAISRYQSGHYSDAVESAMKEINSVVKEIVRAKTGSEYDGDDLMGRAFSVANPILKLTEGFTLSDRNIQQGYMMIAKGAMVGIRNPKAHGNLITERDKAIHLLFLASLLMNKVDERIRDDVPLPTKTETTVVPPPLRS